MIVDYMKQSGQITPEIQKRSMDYLQTGYQDLLGFRVSGGGFSMYGDPPAELWLSAYGLMLMNDMNKVYPVDEELLSSTGEWLLNEQNSDGSWNYNLKETAYIALALSEAEDQGRELNRAINYIKENMDEVKDLYTLALIANLLVYNEPDGLQTEELLKRLEESKIEDKENVYWPVLERTITESYGDEGNIETTALVVQAFLKAGVYGDTVEKALNYLVEAKDTYGGWYSTQATVLSLKALSLAKESIGGESNGLIKVLVDGQEAGKIVITPEEREVIKWLDLKNYTGEGSLKVELVPEGDINCMYQVIYSYYLPWSEEDRQSEGPLSISVDYDRHELKRNDILNSSVTVHNNSSESCETVIIELAVPAGFDVVSGDFDRLLKEEKIERYEKRGRKVILYLDRVKGEGDFTFSYGLNAKFPVNITAPVSEVYEYYNSDKRGYSVPAELKVKFD